MRKWMIIFIICILPGCHPRMIVDIAKLTIICMKKQKKSIQTLQLWQSNENNKKWNNVYWNVAQSLFGALKKLRIIKRNPYAMSQEGCVCCHAQTLK